METRLWKNCCNSAQLTTQKIVKASSHRISYSRSSILPYFASFKSHVHVTCALKGKDFLMKLRTTVWGPDLGRVQFSATLCSKKYFYSKIDWFLYFRYLKFCPFTSCRTLTRRIEAKQGEFVFPKTCFNSFSLFTALKRVTYVTKFFF